MFITFLKLILNMNNPLVLFIVLIPIKNAARCGHVKLYATIPHINHVPALCIILIKCISGTLERVCKGLH